MIEQDRNAKMRAAALEGLEVTRENQPARQTDKHTHTHTDRQTDRQTDRERQRQRVKETERQRHKEREGEHAASRYHLETWLYYRSRPK